MPRAPWFPFYPRDFLSDQKVAVMSALEVGAYIRLLCYAWQEDPPGSLSDRPATLQRLAQLSPTEWEDHKEAILSPFEHQEGRYFQKRMVQESDKTAHVQEARSRGAAITNAKRWGSKNVVIAERSLSDTGATRSLSLTHNHNHNHINNPLPPKQQKPTRRLAADCVSIPLPLFLDKPELRTALGHWIDHKKLKRDPLTQHALDLIVQDCEKWGIEKSIQNIEYSIKRGWKGVYEKNGNIPVEKDRNDVF